MKEKKTKTHTQKKRAQQKMINFVKDSGDKDDKEEKNRGRENEKKKEDQGGGRGGGRGGEI